MSSRRWSNKVGIAIMVVAVFASAVPTSADNAVTYGYDADGRIGSALYDNGLCVAYTYDANGNRTSQTNAVAATPPTWGSAAWGCLKWTAP